MQVWNVFLLYRFDFSHNYLILSFCGFKITIIPRMTVQVLLILISQFEKWKVKRNGDSGTNS